jgi:superfamily II DNA or RNA helicase
LKEQLKENGFIVPSQWVGGYQTRKFVTDLGFPIEFAGFESADRSEHFDVSGPSVLPSLHEFQRLAANNLKDFFKNQERKRRGVLSLPTGSGKTRVTVQAICESLKEGVVSGPILWVAQSDELCEQAVGAWEEVWRSEGSTDSLRVNRLWSTNNANRHSEGQQIVVATIQKLEKILRNISSPDGADYLWLRECRLLVIDEAHLSLPESYTRLINWLNQVEEGKSSAAAADQIHLLGLTATPFRTNERESEWLTSRYNGVRFDRRIFGEEDPYAYLQERQFLSKVRHLLLEGTDIEFTSDERDEWNRTKKLPLSVLRRIGEDRDRNEKVLDAIKNLPDDASVIVFAPSVENAELLAARLVLQGTTAKPVSADTKVGVRRHYIEEFRKKKIKVLTNYGVLTTGFDAPSTNAIVVARPTFSPSLYQQMIGRGLRGPKNNGSEVCTIVNVADNFVAFGEELAFKEFEYLWEKE